ncbi:hypothetical protein FJZ26_03130 [Candidatus Parvarchaeota archaeon]|nr:hypothetical protein [Candidatus Parvarchaeota archaeon]
MLEKIVAGLVGHQDLLAGLSLGHERKMGIEKDLKVAGFDIKAEKFAFASFVIALAIGTYAFACFLLVSGWQDFLFAACVFLLSFAAAFFAALRAPAHLAAKARQEIEADLPLVIGHISVAIALKLPFERLMEEIASAGYSCSRIFGMALGGVRSGESVSFALSQQAAGLGSTQFSRFVSVLLSIYEQGGEAAHLEMLAEEMGHRQLSLVREFGSKAVFGGLLFVTGACVLPAFFMIYGTLLGALDGLGAQKVGAVQMFAAFVLVFPVLDIALLAFISSQAPPALHFRKKLWQEKGKAFGEPGNDAGFIAFGRVFSSQQLVVPCMVLAAVFAAMSVFAWQAAIFAVAFAAIPFAANLYLEYIEEKRIARIEEALPDALSIAAGMQKGTGIEKIAQAAEKFSHGPLSVEFGHLRRQIVAGVPVQDALSQLSCRSSSQLVGRCASLLMLGHKSGHDMRAALRKVAQDIYGLFGLIRERNAATLVQKYTVIAGSTLLVPLVIGLVIGMTGSIAKLSAGGPFGALQWQQEQAYLKQNADKQALQKLDTIEANKFISAAYVAIFSAMAAAFVAFLEGRPRQAIVYALFQVPLSVAVLLAASGLVI